MGENVKIIQLESYQWAYFKDGFAAQIYALPLSRLASSPNLNSLKKNRKINMAE